MKKVFIYGLADDHGNVRYVGQSVNPVQRYIQHLGDAGNTPKALWIQAMQSEGLRPSMVILSESNHRDANYDEKWWITLGVKKGWDLTNVGNPSKQKPAFQGMFIDALRDEFEQFKIEHDPVIMITRPHIQHVAFLAKIVLFLMLAVPLSWVAFQIEHGIHAETHTALFYAFVTFLFTVYTGAMWAYNLWPEYKAKPLVLAHLLPIVLVWAGWLTNWISG